MKLLVYKYVSECCDIVVEKGSTARYTGTIIGSSKTSKGVTSVAVFLIIVDYSNPHVRLSISVSIKDIKPFFITVRLQECVRTRDKWFPCVPSNICRREFSICDYIEQRSCIVLNRNPFCDTTCTVFHPEAYFAERSVPVRS